LRHAGNNIRKIKIEEPEVERREERRRPSKFWSFFALWHPFLLMGTVWLVVAYCL
jgi:hypothetical protein